MEKAIATHTSTLACRCLVLEDPLEKEWHLASVFLPEKSMDRGDCKKVGHSLTTKQQHTSFKKKQLSVSEIP